MHSVKWGKGSKYIFFLPELLCPVHVTNLMHLIFESLFLKIMFDFILILCRNFMKLLHVAFSIGFKYPLNTSIY